MKDHQYGFADSEMNLRLRELAHKDRLAPLKSAIDWELFRPVLVNATRKEPLGPGGRPPIDVVVKFRMLVVQRLYDMSDDALEFHVLDRFTFRSFVGLSLIDEVPDAKTIWEFREKLAKSGALESIWDLFMEELERKGLVAKEGRIVDAEVVESERRHLDKEERARYEANKKTRTDEEGEVQVVKSANRGAQVDLEAGWTQKHGRHYFGYKNTTNVDAGSKLILEYSVDSAGVHDSMMFEQVLDNERDKGNKIYADKGYAGQKCETAVIRAAGPRMACIMHKAKVNKPLSRDQIEQNKDWARVRARVEHVFAWRKYVMKQGRLRTIGKTRAAFTIGLGNLLYNMHRLLFLTRPKPLST